MRIPRQAASAGVSYLAVLIPVFLMGTMIVAYLRLVSGQNHATVRAQSWNTSMVIAESGIEEALAHLNRADSNNFAVSGWTQNGATYSKRTYVTSNEYYNVTIDMSNPLLPAITSEGFVPGVLNTVR